MTLKRVRCWRFVGCAWLAAWTGAARADGNFSFATVQTNDALNRTTEAIGFDRLGNLYVAGNSCVFKVPTTGAATLLAGRRGESGYTDGPGAAARFGYTFGQLAVDAAGNVFIADAANAAVRRIAPDGEVSSVSAGTFTDPLGLAIDRAGNLLVADAGDFTIRRITPAGSVTLIAGQRGQGQSLDGPAATARLAGPNALACGPDDVVYVLDGYGSTLRRISPDGTIVTLAGAAFDRSLVDGAGAKARFSRASGLAVEADGSIYVAEEDDGLLRRVTPEGVVTTIAGQLRSINDYGTRLQLADGIGGALGLINPATLAFDGAGALYVGEAAIMGGVRKGTPTMSAGSPIFLVFPGAQDADVGAGNDVTLKVTLSAATPATLQWRHDGRAIAAATGETLVLRDIAQADAGNYSVVATDADGAETLAVAAVTVYTPPVRSCVIRHERVGGSFLWGIAAGDGRLVAVGTGGTILTSTDGDTWSPVDSSTTEWLLGVTRGPGKFVAVGDHGTVLTSSDAARWTKVATSATTERLNNVTWSAGLFVAVGEHGVIVTSPDGVTWTRCESGLTGWLRGLDRNPSPGAPLNWQLGGAQVTINYPRFMAGGEGGEVIASTDGISWWRMYSTGLQAVEAVTAEGGQEYGVVGAAGATATAYVFGGGTAPPTWMWWRTAVGTSARLRGLADGAGAVFALGDNGEIWAAARVSGPWSPLKPATSASLTAGVFVGNTLYAVGENETILRSAPLAGRLMNLSARGIAGEADGTLISGFVIQGTKPKRMLLRAVGPTLQAIAGLTGAVRTPQLRLTDVVGKLLAQNAAWSTSNAADELAQAAARVGAFPLSRDAADAALLVTLEPGLYSTQVSAQGGAAGLCLNEVYDADVGEPVGARAVNLSTRAEVGTGDALVIAGFVIGGDAPRRVLIRAAGPALHTRFGMNGVLAEPVLTLANSTNTLSRSAAAWGDATNAEEIRDAARRAGAFAFDDGSADAAMVLSLPPGVYTVQVTGKNHGTGVALVEVYDLP